MTTSQSQCSEILRALKSGERLTARDASRRFGCDRLAARVWDLRTAGYSIQTNRVEVNGKHFAEYRLARKARAA